MQRQKSRQRCGTTLLSATDYERREASNGTKILHIGFKNITICMLSEDSYADLLVHERKQYSYIHSIRGQLL